MLVVTELNRMMWYRYKKILLFFRENPSYLYTSLMDIQILK
jgi:hypothetical protein